ncbi:MAG: hypothetical protein EA376_08760 [Phycisphaeraceae bacterium]|nr:MAG: hypothetical protein EA376_08760 [Phycisphaeraceae bacterium]
MSQIPSNLARVPNLLSSQVTRNNITRTSIELLNLQGQLSSGKRINRPSDDPVGAALLGTIDGRLARSGQQLKNMNHGSSSLATVDQSLGEAMELALEARTIASSQIGVGSDASTRKSQAVVVESLIQELVSVVNRRYADIHVLGGERTANPPIERFFEGFRYRGAGEGLLTDIGSELNIPITIGAEQALGSLSARVEGDVDLNPMLGMQTQIRDVRGVEGLGVRMGSIEIEIDDGMGAPTSVTVDLTGAKMVGDVAKMIESAIREADAGALAGAFPGGVAIHASGERYEIDAAAGYTIRINDVGAGSTASDLGLADFNFDAGNTHNPAADLDPRVSSFTRLGQFDTTPAFSPGEIVFRNGGRVGRVDVDATTTVAELQREVEALGLGIRIEISENGRSLNVVNEVSGSMMSVEDSGGGTLTAQTLGIRTLSDTTPLSVFNNGRGVEIAHGNIHPVTGLPDTARNVDFEVTLSDGTTFTVDLTPDDTVSVGATLAAINAAAAAEGVTIGVGPGEFEARLAEGDGRGIVLVDNLGGPDPVTVRSLNGHAAEDLGLMNGESDPGPPATFAGSDRATVRVDSLFSTLMDLKRALDSNDERGIEFAGERIESDIDRLTSVRAVVGGRSQRLDAAQERAEDAQLLDEIVKSGIEDLDLIEATSRFSLLQVIQQAGYQSAAQSQSLSLLNFLR